MENTESTATQEVTGSEAVGGNPVETPSTPEQVTTGEETPTPAKSFTQEQVNEIVRARLNRSTEKFLSKYGCKNETELDELIGKAQAYSVMKERYDGLKNNNDVLNEQVTFMKNNVNPDKYEEVKAYFKGKDMLLNEGTLAEELKTHPYWLNATKTDTTPKTTIKKLGAEANTPPKRDIHEWASSIFGVKL